MFITYIKIRLLQLPIVLDKEKTKLDTVLPRMGLVPGHVHYAASKVIPYTIRENFVVNLT